MFLTCLVPLVLVLAACGGGEVTSSHRNILQEALLTTKDLPGKVAVEGGLPSEPCGPQAIMLENRGKAAETQMFNVADVHLQEAVAIFPREALAKLAFKGL